MAVSLDECDEMIAAAARANVQLLMVSKIQERPVREIRRIVDSGRLGNVFQISTTVFTDWLQRPRTEDELRSDLGGGMLFRQAPHAVDIQRYIVGRQVKSVRAVAGQRDPNFATIGHFSALLAFDGGGVGTINVNGYGYFDGAELTFGIGESGQRRSLEVTRKVRPRRSGPVPVDSKYAKQEGPARNGAAEEPYSQPFYGLTLISGEKGLIRQSENGLLIYDRDGCEEITLPVDGRATTELVELRDALQSGHRAAPDGAWGRDTLAVATAMYRSSQEDREIRLT